MDKELSLSGALQQRLDDWRENEETSETQFFIVKLLVQLHFITEMISWTCLALWKFAQERLTRGTVISTSAKGQHVLRGVQSVLLVLVVRQ